MTSDFIPKRPHKKSRGGCHTCKTKKIKCDEAQPKCSFCEKRKLTCSYISRSTKSTTPSSELSTDAISIISPDASFSLEEEEAACWELLQPLSPITFTGGLSPDQLRLMHHWSTATFNNITWGPSVTNALQKRIPQLAFDHAFLMNGLLGIASLHMQQTVSDPHVYRRQTEVYRAKTLHGFRRALAQVKPRTREYEAVLTMSILLIILYSRDSVLEPGELTTINWLVLYGGLRAVIMIEPLNYPAIKSLEVGCLFQRELIPLKIDPMVPKILVQLLHDIPVSDPDFLQLESYCEILDSLGLLYAGLKQDGIGDNFYVRITAWPSYGNQEFTTSAKARRPRALIIMAYYLVFLKLTNALWWISGIGERDLKTVLGLLGPEWYPYLSVPRQAMTMTNNDDIMKLLLT